MAADLQSLNLSTLSTWHLLIPRLCFYRSSTTSPASLSNPLPYTLPYKESISAATEPPLRPQIAEHCVGDVARLPGLFGVYEVKLRPPDRGGAFWRVQFCQATQDRIRLSQHPAYDGQAKTMVNGPWTKWTIEQDLDEWNEEFMFSALNGDMVLEKNDYWV
jgi:hypothetical protein